ncbi:MAG: nucleotidyltransferase domain-containing protein [Deltaproteobacteria bacterium]|nr:nucleotidyltransferase domain-containing protein [Deltaproteobacteria bacterium]
MTDREREILTQFKSCLAERVPLARLILFGSRARGDAREDSDFDVLVVVDTNVDAAVRRTVSDCAWEVGFETESCIVPVPLSTSEWGTGLFQKSLLGLAVTREGVAA